MFRRAIGSRDSWATLTRTVQYRILFAFLFILIPEIRIAFRRNARSPDRFSISISSILRPSILTIFSISMLCVLARIKFHKCNGGRTTHRWNAGQESGRNSPRSERISIERVVSSQTPRGRARYLWRWPIAIRTANRANSQSDQAVFNSSS